MRPESEAGLDALIGVGQNASNNHNGRSISLGQGDECRDASVTSGAILQDVIAYFDSKTHSILKRYGPGPRVHYHTGLVDDLNQAWEFAVQRLAHA